MDEATATPITPPRFWEVDRRPDATPASRSAIPVSAPIETGMKLSEVPTPQMKNGPARSRQKLPWGGAWVAHSIPVPIRVMPAAMAALGEVLVTSFWDRPAQASEVTEAVIQAAPVATDMQPMVASQCVTCYFWLQIRRR